jgi:hypothetical protein
MDNFIQSPVSEVGMDQRFANRSHGQELRDSDGTYLADQVALLDHLKIQRCPQGRGIG